VCSRGGLKGEGADANGLAPSTSDARALGSLVREEVGVLALLGGPKDMVTDVELICKITGCWAGDKQELKCYKRIILSFGVGHVYSMNTFLFSKKIEKLMA
jgi:hypothetical protein